MQGSSSEPTVVLGQRERLGVLGLAREWARLAWGFARKYPMGGVSAVIILGLIIAAVFAPWVSPADPYQISYADQYVEPGRAHLFGTDNLGRDQLSRVIYGARISLYVALVSIITSGIVGTVLGLMSGYFGGRADTIIQTVIDIMLAFPVLILALAIVAMLGTSINNVIIAIAVVQMPRVERLIRSSVLAEKGNQYVDAAVAMGCSGWRVMFRHIFPQTIAPLIVFSTAGIGSAVLIEASLAFLGLGAQPPTPSWGLMLSHTAMQYFMRGPWLAIYPGIVLSLAVFAFNLLGDSMRDALDPRLRR